ncbi:MAG: tetratricopeptide repeat protein [Chthoniobacterales bacterium]|nr:tetratricopeptide repeat protein [Chthoniobacterales bacterium]
MDPKNAKAETNLANALLRKGMRPEARRHYEHALSVDSGLVLAHKHLGDILLGSGEYDAAVAQYSEALRLNPALPNAKDDLSFARSLAGR